MAKRKTSTQKRTAAKKHLFVVGTMMTFEHRYLVEADSAEAAEQFIASRISGDGLWEWQQQPRGETVVYSRRTSLAQAKAEHTNDTEQFGAPWLPVSKFITRP
jgi:hypothetical protein